MSLGQDLAAGIRAGQALFEPLMERKRQERKLAEEVKMLGLKNQAELAQHLALKKADRDAAIQLKEANLKTLAAKFGGQQGPEVPTMEQINQVAQAQAPQAPPAPSMEAFNPKKWQSENYQDFIDPDTGTFDEKGFRQGLKNAVDEYQNQQYLKSQDIDLPVSMLKSPFVGDIIKTKQEARKLEKDKAYVTQYAKRNGLNLSPEEVEAYASRPGVIEAIQSNKEQERRFQASEAHASKREAIASARLEKALSRVGGGSGSGGGWKQTRMGGYVKVDKRGNPTGQTITATEAYDMGITNTPPPARKPRGMGGGAKAPIPVPKINL